MSTLLHVSASPRDAASDSRALAIAFLDPYRRAHPDVAVEELDLFDGTLSAVGHLAAEAKMVAWGGMPYVLKRWIDIISQPGWLFSFTPDSGYSGPIRGRKAAVICTGVYQPGAPLAYGNDFHTAFFNDWLRFAGLTDVAEIRWQPTAHTATRDTEMTAALQRAAEAGSHF